MFADLLAGGGLSLSWTQGFEIRNGEKMSRYNLSKEKSKEKKCHVNLNFVWCQPSKMERKYDASSKKKDTYLRLESISP